MHMIITFTVYISNLFFPCFRSAGSDPYIQLVHHPRGLSRNGQFFDKKSDMQLMMNTTVFITGTVATNDNLP